MPLHLVALSLSLSSGLKLLQNQELIDQLKIRRVVDGRTESSGKTLICTPPPKEGRTWLVLKLHGTGKATIGTLASATSAK